jgi:hypothetical protein
VPGFELSRSTKSIHRLGRLLSKALILATCSGVLPSCSGCGRGSSPVGVNAPSDAGAPTTEGIELANHQAGPEFIAVDDRFVYWTNFQDDGVMKIAKDGAGLPIEISRNDRGENKGIAVDDTAVYWGGTSLYKQVKSTGDIQRFNFNSTLVYNLLPIGGRIYWIDDGKSSIQLKSMKSDGTDVQAIGPAETQAFSLVRDGSSGFIGRFKLDADDVGQIDTIPLGGGSPSLFARTRFIWKIATDAHFVYWMEGKTVGAIKKKPKTGGDEIMLTQGIDIARPQSLAADDSSLYWTELGAGPGQGAVGKVSKAGGDAHLIATHQIVPQAIAVDGEFAYWVNFGPTNNGTIRKIRKSPDGLPRRQHVH